MTPNAPGEEEKKTNNELLENLNNIKHTADEEKLLFIFPVNTLMPYHKYTEEMAMISTVPKQFKQSMDQFADALGSGTNPDLNNMMGDATNNEKQHKKLQRNSKAKKSKAIPDTTLLLTAVGTPPIKTAEFENPTFLDSFHFSKTIINFGIFPLLNLFPEKPIAMADGVIRLTFKCGIRLEMTVDRAIRLIDPEQLVSVALSGDFASSAILHPNGRVLQINDEIQVLSFDARPNVKRVRYVKLASDRASSVGKVENFETLFYHAQIWRDHTRNVFERSGFVGSEYYCLANMICEQFQHYRDHIGTDILLLNGLKILCFPSGMTKIVDCNNKTLMKISNNSSCCMLQTKNIYCTASRGGHPHLYVRQDKKVVFDENGAILMKSPQRSVFFCEERMNLI